MYPELNFIWDRNPEEAFQNPYEYNAQKQFHREAKALLILIQEYFIKANRKYNRDDRSLEKAVWMLSLDSCEALQDCLDLLKKSRHSMVGRIMRDIIETMNLTAYFTSNTKESTTALWKWYNDEIIVNRDYRNFVSKHISKELGDNLAKEYRMFSKFTHRTYRTLSYSYVLGKDKNLLYEGEYKHLPMVPATISMYYALIAYLIRYFVNEIVIRAIIPKKDIEYFYELSIEKRPAKRKFVNKVPPLPL